MNTAIIVACVAGITYFMFIRPKLRERKAINDTRDWLRQQGMPIPDKPQPVKQVGLPSGIQMITDSREYWGYPPKRDHVFEEIQSGDEVAGEWDYAVHIHEAAEQYLGSKEFFGLEKRFASIPGVEKCKQEDREIFLVKTRTLDPESVRDAFWQEFLKASQLAIEGEKKR